MTILFNNWYLLLLFKIFSGVIIYMTNSSKTFNSMEMYSK